MARYTKLNEAVKNKIIMAIKALKAGPEPLANRHTLTINNDSSNVIYVGFEPDFNISGSITVFSGVTLSISLNPSGLDDQLRFYAKTEENEATVKILEVS